MKKIYVGNLAYGVDEEKLQATFGPFGDIQDLKLIRDQETGRSKGFAFIEYGTQEQAQEAIKLNGQDLDGRPLTVNIARERTPGGGGGNRAGGRGGRPGGGGGRGGYGGGRDGDSGGRRW